MSSLANNKIIFYTGNKGKVKEIVNEFKKLNCNYEIIMEDIEIPEIQSISNKEVIESKLEYVKNRMTKNELQTKSFIVEDTGLYIDNMNKFPGALIKFYLESIGVEGISRFNNGSLADAETWIGLWDARTQTNNYFTGQVKGHIATNPRGCNGFGYDPIFIPNNINEYNIQTSNDDLIEILHNIENKTFSEFTDNEKAMCNQRTIAGSKLANYLIN
jgi:non-canonical purine NTP pyrophosphatase (RdgB/HAM1 family)